MLTGMTEGDWAAVLKLFRACRSRRGDKGRNDRKFLEALHYFTVHNVTWRALPAEFGNWNSIWKRFWRLSQAGCLRGLVRGARREQPDRPSRADVRLHHRSGSCLSRRRPPGRRKRGASSEALGRSRGGFSTKIHIKVDLDGLPLAFHLTPGQASDSRQFEILLDLGSDIAPRAAVGDKGYDAKANRAAARKRGICPVIPVKSSAKERPAFFPKALYRARARIEQLVGKLKRFKRIALRCEKTNRNFGSFVAFALGLIILKSVHTA